MDEQQHDAKAPAAVPSRRRRLRWTLISAAGVLVVVLALLTSTLGGLWWGLHNERGTAWMLSRLPGVQVVKPRGALLGDFGADAIVWRFGDGGELRLVDVAWTRFELQRSAAPGAWVLVSFDRLRAASAKLTLPRREQTNRQPPPQHLQLPVELVVKRLELDELQAAPLGDVPLTGLRAAIHLGDESGRVHRLNAVTVSRGPLSAQAEVQVGALAPMASDIRVRLAQAKVADWPAWNAQLRLDGPLAKSHLSGLWSVAAATPQSLNLDATVQPFAEWPLAQLKAEARALDISALLAGGPRTALSGSVTVGAADAEKPLDAQVALRNELAGAYDQGLLPVRQATLQLTGDPRDRNRVQLRAAEVQLGTEQSPAGVLQGDGAFSTTQGWDLRLALQDLRPDRLDARAWPMTVSGPVTLAGRDVGGGGGKPPDTRTVQLQAQLGGQASASDRRGTLPVNLKLQGRFDTERSGSLRGVVDTLQLASGASSASFKGEASRSAATAPWQTRGSLRLAAFDPRPWWPLALGGRLDGEAEFALGVPAKEASMDLMQWLATLQGQADVKLLPSTLSGVPLQGNAVLKAHGAQQGLELTMALNAADNQLMAQGRLAPQGQQDHWQGRIAAPALQRLAPLARALAAAGKGQAPAVGGAVQGEWQTDGRWPRLQTRGELTARNVVWPGLRLQSADARWQLGTGAGAPMNAQVRLAQLTLPDSQQARQVPSLALGQQGTAESHRLDLRTEVVDATPPAAAAQAGQRAAAPARAGPRTLAQLQASGGFLHEGGRGPLDMSGWRGRIALVDLRRAEPGDPLLHAADLGLLWRAQDERRPMSVDLQPGRAQVMSGAVSWREATWQGALGRQPAQARIDATLEPLQVAPLLARMQPALGWRGDLVVGGRLVLRTAPRLVADAVLQRQRGDLQMVQGTLRRALGLEELRLSAKGDGPLWRLQARTVSRNFGQATADVSLRAPNDSPWPTTTSPMQGNVQLRVADLGLYDALLPVGWRLDGQLLVDARLGGTLGAPQYSGRVQGTQLGVGNFVEGVRVRDGELRASLDGMHARVERFVAKAGDGQVRIDGGAVFGAQPTVRLNVVADRFRALGRVDRQVDQSGQAQLRMDAQGIGVQGRLKVDQGLVDLGRGEAPELSADVRVVDGPTPGRPVKTSASGTEGAAARKVDLDLHIDLGEKLRVRGKGINTLLAGAVHVTAPGGQLALDGTVRTVKGTYEAYGEKLRIERGLITFNGPVANPRLDIQAVRPDLRDLEVGVAITGTAQNPQVALFSSPEMSELDKLSWLTLGRSSAGLASDQTALLQRAAMALLASRRGSSGGEGVAKRLGLDTISVKRGASGGLSDAVVSLGKQVSERVYVGYSQSLDATGGGWELVYKIAKRLTVRVETGEQTAIDLVWTWLWG
jgi:translocation and assembly module TamB